MTVTVQSALTEVQASARRLSEVAGELVLAAVEDQPRNCQVHLVAVVHDAALEVADQADQADTVLSPRDGDDTPSMPAGQAVARCQRHVMTLGAALVRGLATPEMHDDLAVLGRERGREVSAWVREVIRCVQACQLALWTEMQPALLGYWQELADIAGRSHVSGDGR
jgi:hypothetical protein